VILIVNNLNKDGHDWLKFDWKIKTLAYQTKMGKNNTHPWNIKTREKVVKDFMNGKSQELIKKDTEVSKRSQQRFIKMTRDQQSLGIKKRSQIGISNNHSKVTQEYLDLLEKDVKQNSDSTDNQRMKVLEAKTGIKITPKQLGKWRRKLNITKKLKTTFYNEGTTPINQLRRKEFIKQHDPKVKGNKYIPLDLCSSTDEMGKDNNTIKKRGFSKTRLKSTNHNRGLAGGSYRSDQSRVFAKQLKHSKFTLHVIATICLDPTNPVPMFKINTENTNGVKFGEYVEERELPKHIKFDIIDRHSAHKCVKANEQKDELSIKDQYKLKGIIQDFTPGGTPEMNEIELFFAYLNKYIEDRASKFNDGSGWTQKNLTKILYEAKDSVTFRMVQGWYAKCWSYMYPKRQLPIYLRSDTSISNFQNIVDRHLKEYNLKNPGITTTRSGRKIIKKLF
jgi:transposase